MDTLEIFKIIMKNIRNLTPGKNNKKTYRFELIEVPEDLQF